MQENATQYGGKRPAHTAFEVVNTGSKYTAALPSGEGYSLLQDDPEQVAFLVDGWEYYPGELLTPEALAGQEAEQHTYSGEYPNFSHHLGSPYDTATYRLVLENRGGPRELSLYLPELLCAGRIYVNGTLAGEQGAVEPYKPHVVDGVYSFPSGRSGPPSLSSSAPTTATTTRAYTIPPPWAHPPPSPA